jgi:iron complex outermembrane receptor protein
MSPPSRRGGRFPGLLLAFMLILCSGLPLARLDAAAEERRSFALAGGRAEETLEMFSEQAGAQIVYLLEDVRGVVTIAVHGDLAVREALERLVTGTRLVVKQDGKSGAFVVKRGSPPPNAPQTKVPAASLPNPMKKPLLARLGSAFTLVAASALAAEPAPGSGRDEAVVLSPFEVNSSKDVGYLAKDTLAGSRLNTSLKDVGAQVSIMTPEFLQDVAAVTMEDAFRYSLNIESTEEFYDVTSSNNATLTTQTINGNNRARGLGQSTPTHDFFPTNIPIDAYNTERFTFVSGPNAILFGSGNPSGNSDTSFKRARVNKASYSLETRFDTNDSARASIDLNQPLIKNKLAVRFAGVKSDARTARKPNFDRQERAFVTLEVKPYKWISARAYMENVYRDRTPVRNTVITDAITPWINAGRPLFDNGAGKPLPANVNTPGLANYNPAFQIYNATTFPVVLMGNTAGTSPAGFQYANNTVVTRSFDTAAISPDNFDRSLSDGSLFPLDTNFTGNALQNRLHADIRGFTIELNPLKNFYLEIGNNQERYISKFVDLVPFAGTELRVDPNMFLPDRVTPNPNVGRYYLTTTPGSGASFYRFDSRRASASYDLNLTEKPGWQKWIGRHRVAALWSKDELRDGRANSDFKIINTPASLAANYTTANVSNPADSLMAAQRSPRIRYYLDNPQDPASKGRYSVQLPFDPFAPGVLPGTDWQVATLDNPLGASNTTNSRRHISSNVQTIQSFFLKDKVVVTYGRREDVSKSYSIDTTRQIRTGTNGGPGIGNNAGYAWWYDQFDARKQQPGAYALDQTRSGKTDIIDVVVHPFRWLSLFYSESNTHDAPSSIKLNLDGTTPPVGDGVGKNYGITFHLLKDNLMLRINRQSTSVDDGINNTLRAAGGLGGTNPFRGLVYNIESAVLLAGAPSSVKFANFSESVRAIGTASRPASQRETYDVYSDIVSRGTEIELIANPTPNWRLSASFARNDAVESNLAASWFAFIEDRLPTWAAYKTAFVFPSTTQRINDLVVGNAINSWNFIREQEGKSVAQMSRDRMNATARYGFSRGFAKGAFVGGSWRYRSPAVIGYGSKTARGSELSFSEGFVGPNDVLTVSDLSKPISGRALNEFDGFIGYSRRIFQNKVGWRVQVNIRNLLDDVDRRGQGTTSAGDIAVFTIPEKRTFILTNTFTF